MKRVIIAFIFTCFSVVLFAQAPYLKSSIGLNVLPADNEVICTIPTYTGSYYTSGYQKGDTINDFTLYTLSGLAVNAKTLLQQGKPLLLVNGSYTCPVFRGKVSDMNNMQTYYGNKLNVYVVYTVEAHPATDVSPYSGNVWVTSANQTQGVLYRQPATYGERKAVVDSMLSNNTITPQVLIDGPCNKWWSNFGPAPNNAYLIDTNGIIQAKHGWFHKLPDNMWCDIDTFLGTSSGKCIAVPNNGNFTFKLDKDSTDAGAAGKVLEIHSTLYNTSSNASVSVDIFKLRKNLPPGWETALCTDVCLSTDVDSTRVTIAPLDSQSFTFYFYTDSIAATGDVEVGLRNANNSSNKYKQKFYGSTYPVSITDKSSLPQWSMYPNPSTNHVNITLTHPKNDECIIMITDVTGRVVKEFKNIKTSTFFIGTQNLVSGMYFVQLSTADKEFAIKKLMVQ